MQYCLTADELAQIEAELADVLQKVREADDVYELDALLEKHLQFRRCVAQKNRSTEKRVWTKLTSLQNGKYAMKQLLRSIDYWVLVQN